LAPDVWLTVVDYQENISAGASPHPHQYALLSGETFIDIVSMVLTIAGLNYATRPVKMMEKETISYRSAQLLIPAISGLLAEQSGSYSDDLYVETGIMVLWTLLVVSLKLEKTGKGGSLIQHSQTEQRQVGGLSPF
jgi:hypothetical protein